MTSDRIKRRIDSLLDQADEAVAGLEWAVVRDRARAVLALDSDNTDAAAYLASAERELTRGVQTSPAEEAVSQPPKAAPSAPTSFANGRYSVKRFLGEGGKKRVYLAHDADSTATWRWR